jgi:hypothetical protein
MAATQAKTEAPSRKRFISVMPSSASSSYASWIAALFSKTKRAS